MYDHPVKARPMTQPPRFCPAEMRKIDQLVGAALVQPHIGDRLLRRDNSLVEEFDLSQECWHDLKTIRATNLSDFCQRVMALQQTA